MNDRHVKNGSLLICFSFVCLSACTLAEKDDPLSADEAKMEIRAASQTISSNMDELRQTQAMQTMGYLIDLLSVHEDGKSFTGSVVSEVTPCRLLSTSQMIADIFLFGKDRNNLHECFGTYRYNFNTSAFDLVDGNVNYMHYIFPSNESTRIQKDLNASWKVENMKFTTIFMANDQVDYEEDLLTNANAALVVDNKTILSLEYEAAYNEYGMPTSIELAIIMSPYQLRMSLGGSGQNYSSTMSVRQGGNNMMSYSFSIRYNSEKDDADRISGYLEVHPLRFEGSFNQAGLTGCDDADMTCRNNNTDILLKHAVINKKIGQLEYRMASEADCDDQCVNLHVVYEDGSSEPFSVIFDPGAFGPWPVIKNSGKP